MITLRVPGTEDMLSGASGLAGQRGYGMKVTQKKAYRIERGRAAEKPAEVEDARADDVIEIELEGGLKLWTTVEQFEKDFGQKVRGEEGVLAVPAALPLGGPSRGWGSWALKGLRLFNVDLAGMAASKIAEKLEERITPGLHRCLPGDSFALGPLEKVRMPTDTPILLFIHGTASNTEGSFGGLWAEPNQKIRRAIFQQYNDQIYAFEHRTLSESPLENAIEILQTVSKGAKLHLVTHSRGGLVGELICRGTAPFDDQDHILFEGQEHQTSKNALEELKKILKGMTPQVERFIRVACPAKGTSLASERLDRWLSIIVNLVGRIPGLAKNPAYELLTDFMLAVVKEGTKPDKIPGLEAMMPTSALIRLLNRPGVTVDADLSVIAGDVEGTSLLGRLKCLIPDLYFHGDHDLVVDTRNMYGGAERTGRTRAFFDQGPDVNHFSYFRNERTARLVFAGLARQSDSDAGFTPVAVAREALPATVRRSVAPTPVVFVVPGIMGTHLSVRGNRIWLDPVDIARGRFERLKIDNPDVVPEAPVGPAYADLIEYLADSHEVAPFPYDWRKPVRDEAHRLADAVAAKLDSAERANQPVRILAHSMGGLVARAMIRLRQEVWSRIITHPGGRLIMLGTPTNGSYVIPRILLGQEKILHQLALVDSSHSVKDMLQIISRFPGILDMLPAPDGTDFFSSETWQGFAANDPEGWVMPDRKDLVSAQELRTLIDESPIHPDRMLYVAGHAPQTPVGMEIDLNEQKGSRFKFLATGRGDGRVPWDTGIPKGLRTWYMDAEHGNLADYEPAFPAILDLLINGTTERLRTTPPVVERGAEVAFPIPPEKIDIYPDGAELIATAVGGHPRVRPSAKRLPVWVSVAHGDLSFTRQPVAVGHYQGDSIVSAEDYLDRHLDGMLRRRDGLGLYPGPLLTGEIFFNPDPNRTPAGAIVVGLGAVGRLTAAELRRSMARALVKFAVARLEREREKSQGEPGIMVSAAFTSLLIGTGAGGLSVENSVIAILHGVHRANLALEKAKLDRQVVIDRVEFIELWQDRAILAARALERVHRDPELKGGFECKTEIRQFDGGKHRLLYDEPNEWWDRLQILGAADGSLRFSAVTRRARAEVSLIATQRQLADQFIAQAITVGQTSRGVTKTLFEMLVPNDLKEQAPERRNLVLIVNQDSARYPWELMEDRWGDTNRPLAVEAGIIRQLETESYRRQPIMASLRTALVVGDPHQTLFMPLPGAEQEAKHVAELLGQMEFKVTSRIKKNADAILNALHAQEYQILHLAGHGVYEHPISPEGKTCACCRQNVEKETVTGMVIGDGAFLTPAEVNQMRRVPEVVFLNCCYLGKIEEGRKDTDRSRHNQLAANLAAQFINMGVRAVIAAGWPVDDAAAKTFARCFYEQLLSGVPFGESVHTARKETFESHGSVNTWGAYQCYGDPEYRIDVSLKQTEKPREMETFSMIEELLATLDNIAEEAKTASVERARRLVAMLEDILKQTEQHRTKWIKNSRVQAAFGNAFGELDRFAEAVEHYKAAIDSAKSDYPVKAIEQWANLTCRYALEKAKRSSDVGMTSAKLKDIVTSVEKAIEVLQKLREISPTSERLCLLGSAHKRAALIFQGNKRKNAIKMMAKHYEEAMNISDEKDYYPILNELTARIVGGWLKAGGGMPSDAEVERLTATCESLAQAEENTEPSFWSLVTIADCLLIRNLAGNTLPEKDKEVSKKYREAADRAVSPRQLRSVIEQIDFLIAMIASAGVPAQVARQEKALVGIREELATWAGGSGPLSSVPSVKKRRRNKGSAKKRKQGPSKGKPGATLQ